MVGVAKTVDGFLDRKVEASLKEARRRGRERAHRRIPRPKGRGLIEGRRAQEPRSGAPERIPRPKGRGLIEGPTLSRADRGSAAGFLDRKVEASLKAEDDGAVRAVAEEIPRPKGRGLIEGHASP